MMMRFGLMGVGAISVSHPFVAIDFMEPTVFFRFQGSIKCGLPELRGHKLEYTKRRPVLRSRHPENRYFGGKAAK